MSKPFMGLGQIGDANIIFRSHRCRWTLQATFPAGNIDEHFVRMLHRPNDSKMITTTIADVVADDPSTKSLFNVFASLYDFATGKVIASPPPDQLGEGTLKLYDGYGTPLETWHLKGLWPQAINFADFDCSSSSTCDIEITWHYSESIYENF